MKQGKEKNYLPLLHYCILKDLIQLMIAKQRSYLPSIYRQKTWEQISDFCNRYFTVSICQQLRQHSLELFIPAKLFSPKTACKYSAVSFNIY